MKDGKREDQCHEKVMKNNKHAYITEETWIHIKNYPHPLEGSANLEDNPEGHTYTEEMQYSQMQRETVGRGAARGRSECQSAASNVEGEIHEIIRIRILNYIRPLSLLSPIVGLFPLCPPFSFSIYLSLFLFFFH